MKYKYEKNSKEFIFWEWYKNLVDKFTKKIFRNDVNYLVSLCLQKVFFLLTSDISSALFLPVH